MLPAISQYQFMNDILKNRDTVLFLGAGFSADSDLPVMAEFGRYIEDEHMKFKKRKHDDPCAKPNQKEGFRKAGPMLVESFEVFKLFQNFCRQSKIMSEKAIQNMEQIFAVAETLRESGISHINLDGTTYDIHELISHIQLALWKVYHTGRLAKKNDTGDYTKIRKKIYEPFFRQVIDHADSLTIITTNYDLNIEYLSYVVGGEKYRCVYPIINDGNKYSIIAGQRTIYDMNTFNKRYVTYLQSYIGGDMVDYSGDGQRAPLLCKLHGSINYFHDSRKEAGQNIYIADDLGNDEDIGFSNKWKDEPSIFAVDAIWNLQNKYGRSLTPAIIPPTYSKLAGYEWLREIWNAAILALAKAKKIVFVGYRFPETDGFMSAMLQGALAMSESDDIPEIHVIDKSQETIERYEELFGTTLKSSSKMSLEEAVEKNVLGKLLS